MKYTLVIEGFLLPLINSVRNKFWTAEHRVKKKTTQRLVLEAMVQGVPAAQGKRSVKITMHGWGTGGGLPDRDAPLKLSLDSMKRAGLILDDGEHGIAGMPLVEFVRSKEVKTIIELEDE